jgi:hypothetical protein
MLHLSRHRLVRWAGRCAQPRCFSGLVSGGDTERKLLCIDVPNYLFSFFDRREPYDVTIAMRRVRCHCRVDANAAAATYSSQFTVHSAQYDRAQHRMAPGALCPCIATVVA